MDETTKQPPNQRNLEILGRPNPSIQRSSNSVFFSQTPLSRHQGDRIHIKSVKSLHTMVFGIQEIYLPTWDASTELQLAWGNTSHEIGTFSRDLRFDNDIHNRKNVFWINLATHWSLIHLTLDQCSLAFFGLSLHAYPEHANKPPSTADCEGKLACDWDFRIRAP